MKYILPRKSFSFSRELGFNCFPKRLISIIKFQTCSSSDYDIMNRPTFGGLRDRSSYVGMNWNEWCSSNQSNQAIVYTVMQDKMNSILIWNDEINLKINNKCWIINHTILFQQKKKKKSHHPHYITLKIKWVICNEPRQCHKSRNKCPYSCEREWS